MNTKKDLSINYDDSQLKPQDTRLWRRFLSFHEQNPHVYDEFVRVTNKAIDRGYTRISSDFIVHIMRWESRIQTSGDAYRLNKIYPAYYSRLFMLENPEHRGLFEIRRLRHGGLDASKKD